jgi:hypothetical protein
VGYKEFGKKQDFMAIEQRALQGLWLKSLLFVLFGYFLLGKGFAYLFLGEALIVFGFVIFLMSQKFMLLFTDPVLFLWAMFAMWGFCRTVPYLSQYRFDALRDAVLWGYGTVALLIAAFVSRSSQISRALNAYRKFLRWYLIVLPVVLIATAVSAGKLLLLPWSNGVGLIYVKGGDAGVDLAVAGLFLLIFTDKRRGIAKEGISVYRLVAIAGAVVTLLFIMVANRGGTVALILAFLLVAILRARQMLWKLAFIGIMGGILAAAVFAVLPAQLRIGGKVYSEDKAVATVGTIVGGSGKGTGHENTVVWRLIWWKAIIHETFFGPYFWTGRGFGVNLAIADGPVGGTKEDYALRSPHNGSMTVLARMGVPGFVLWVGLNLVFAFRLLRAQRRAAVMGSQFWSGLNLWILACWLATLTNSTFDVYLEGPQGGIWFWSIIGFGVAALRIQSYETRASLSPSRTRSFEQIASANIFAHT